MSARLIPDLDDEITGVLFRLEELLVLIAASEDENPGQGWPAGLAGGRALEAVQHLWDAIAPAQSQHAAAGTGRMLAPGGRYAHIPLRLVSVDDADVAALSAAAAALGSPDAPDCVRQALTDTTGTGTGEAAGTLVMAAARLAGILDLAADHDTTVLTSLLTTAAGNSGGDIVLTPTTEAAYQRYITRFNDMWALSDPLARWQY